MVKKTIVFVGLLVFIGINSNAQTKLIFHKSHSGSSWNFNPNTRGNLGLVEPFSTLRNITKINDSTVILLYDYSDGTVNTDTLVNDPYWKDLDSSNFMEKTGSLENPTFMDLSKKNVLDEAESQKNVQPKAKKKKSPKRKD